MGYVALFLIIVINRMALYARHTPMTIQPIQIMFENSKSHEYEAYIPTNTGGDLILNMYLKNINISNLERIYTSINDEIIQSFTGEYIALKLNLETSTQKIAAIQNSKYIPIPCTKYMQVYPNMKVVVVTKTLQTNDIKLFIDFLFCLNEPIKSDMLIQQVQEFASIINPNTTSTKMYTNFKHIVKELYIIVQDVNASSWLDFLSGASSVQTLSIEFDNNKKVEQSAMYFSKIQPLDYHTTVPVSPTIFFTYSFALDPEADSPTGHVNMGMIKNQTITIKHTSSDSTKRIKVYAIGYNIISKDDGKLVFT
jgi:hypothetical protein